MKKISLLGLFTLVFAGCENWMNNDDFFKNIEEEVFEAKAEQIETNVRFAVPNVMGTTEPNGRSQQKVGVPFNITATTADEYGFYRWYAFLTDDLWDPTPDDDDNTLSSFFDLNSSNSKVMYTSEKMLEILNAHALTYDVVSFGDSENQSESNEAALKPSTTVTIKKKLNNIVIVPVCANKISVVESDPSANKSAVPINKTIKIAFSKPLPLSNFATDDGLSSKITIRHRSSGTFGSLDYVDISNRFDVPYFQDLDSATNTGRVLVLPLKSNEVENYYLAENSLHEITIDSSIVDALGYSMGKDFTLTFTTSSQKDENPPSLLSFSAGVTSPFEFDKADINPTSKDLSSYTAYLGNRTSADSLFFYLRAGDIASEEDLPDEEQVLSYFIRAKTLISSLDSFTGEPMDFIEYEYIPGSIPSALENGKTFSEITGSDEGLLGTIDISSLADGLIDLQVYAVDKIGNSGEDSEIGDQLRTNAHVLFIKDTTPPVASINNIVLKTAKNGYLNEQSIGNLSFELKDIKDFGLDGIGSETVYALATASKNADKPSANDANWKNVKNSYNLRGITTEIDEGNVPLTFWFKDESGNISNPVLYSQILYDKTAPVINDLSWVYEDGSEASPVYSATSNKRFIKIDFQEQLSGVANIDVVVKDQLTGVNVNNALNNLEIYSGLPSASPKIIYAKSSNKISIDSVASTEKNHSLYLYIDLSENSLSSTSIFVTLTDDAGNNSVEKEIDSIIDSTPPIVSNFHIANKKEKKVFGLATVDNEKWLSYHSKGTGYCNLEFEIQEHQSGIQKFEIIQQVKGNSIPFIIEKNFGILLNDVALTNDKDFTTSVTFNDAEKTITYTVNFINSINPIINAKTETESLRILVKDLLLYSKDNEGTVSLKVKDFVNHESTVRSDSVYIGNSEDTIDSAIIKSMDETDPAGYSDAYTSTLTLTNSAKAIKTAGIEKITLENAHFQNTTKVILSSGDFVNRELVKNQDYTVEDFTDTLIFKDKVLYGTYTLTFTDIKQKNQSIGTEQICLNATNMSGYKTETIKSNELIVDVETPSIDTYFLNATALDASTESQLIKTRVHINEDENLELVLTVRVTEEGTGIKKIKLPAWNALTNQQTGTNAADYESIEISRRSSFADVYKLSYSVDFENRELILTEPFVSDGYDNTLYIRRIPAFKNSDLDDNYGETRFELSLTDLVGRTSETAEFSIAYKDSVGKVRQDSKEVNVWRGPKVIEGTYDADTKTARIKLTHIYPYITQISIANYTLNGESRWYYNNSDSSCVIKMIRADGSELLYTEDENKETDLLKETAHGYPVDSGTLYKLPALFDYFDFDYNEEVIFEISGITKDNPYKKEIRFYDTFYPERAGETSVYDIEFISDSQ